MIKLRVNGRDETFNEDPSMPLLWYLRDQLGLTGTKFGCGVAQCGSCTVHLDGDAVRLDPQGDHPVQKAWRTVGVPQCGYCQSGQIMQAAALLQQTKSPSDGDIDSAMSGNICRCGTYQRIRAAIKAAAKGA